MSRADDLHTPKLLLTRPAAQSARFKQQLLQSGFQGEILISPLLKIAPTHVVPDLSDYSGVIFTSRTAVDLASPLPITAWCVGDQTAEAANAAGWSAISAGGDVNALYERIVADAPEGKILHLRGHHTRGDLVGRLRKTGIHADAHILYEQPAVSLTKAAKSMLAGEAPVIVPLFSPRTAEQFLKQGPFAAPIWVVSLSGTIAESVAVAGAARHIKVPMPTADHMVEGINCLIDAP